MEKRGMAGKAKWFFVFTALAIALLSAYMTGSADITTPLDTVGACMSENLIAGNMCKVTTLGQCCGTDISAIGFEDCAALFREGYTDQATVDS